MVGMDIDVLNRYTVLLHIYQDVVSCFHTSQIVIQADIADTPEQSQQFHTFRIIANQIIRAVVGYIAAVILNNFHPIPSCVICYFSV